MASQVLEEMIIKISAETGNLKTEMAKVKDQLEKVGSTAKKESDNTKALGDSFKKLAVAAAGLLAVKAMVTFVSDSGKAAVENQKSFALMAMTLKNATGATRAQVDAVEAQIGAMSRATGVLDDNIRPAFDVLVRSTGDSTTALQLQQVALDVAAGTGKDLTTVSQAMAKAYEGNTGALAKLIPSVKGLADPLGAAASQFKGMAETAANADPYQRMTVAMDQIRESVGSALLPILEKFAKWLIDAVPQIQAFFTALTDPTTALGAQFEALTNTISNAFNFITSNLGTISGFALVLGGLATAIVVVNSAWTAYQTVVGLATAAQALLDIAVGAFNPVALAIGVGVLGLAIGGIAIAGFQAADGINAMNNALSVGPKATAQQEAAALLIAQSDIALKYGTTATKVKELTQTWNAMTEDQRKGWVLTHGQQKKVIDDLIATKQVRLDEITSTSAAQKSAHDKRLSWNAAYNARKSAQDAKDKAAADAKAAAEAKANAKAAADAKAVQDKALQATQAYQAKLQSIISKSLQSLRDAFTSAAKVDIGSMFASMQEQGETSAESLLASLKDKLAKIQQLARDAASLAGAGFSELFIEQVVAQGPDVGDALAQSILTASTDTQQQLKSSFAESVQLGSGSFITGSKTSLNAKQLLALGETSGGQAVVGSKSSVTINAPVSVQTNASPTAIAQATVSAIKFGLPMLAGN